MQSCTGRDGVLSLVAAGKSAICSKAIDLCVSQTAELGRKYCWILADVYTALCCCHTGETGLLQLCLEQIQKMTTVAESYKEPPRPRCHSTLTQYHTAADTQTLW